MIAYLNGKYAPIDQLFISPEDRGFLFADGVYEVIRSYNGHLFKLEDHIKRLERNIRELRLNFTDVGKLKQIADRLIQDNDLSSCGALIYTQITRGSFPRSHGFPPKEVQPTIYASIAKFQPHIDRREKGINVILTPDIRWTRCDIKTVSLLPNILANQQALDREANEAIFVRDGVVTEGTRSNFLGVFDGKVVTAPKSNYILPGITRSIVLNLCSKEDIPVKEFPIFENQLKEADELFVVGTGSEITPVVKVDGCNVRDGKPGPITRKLQQVFDELIEKSLGK